MSSTTFDIFSCDTTMPMHNPGRHVTSMPLSLRSRHDASRCELWERRRKKREGGCSTDKKERCGKRALFFFENAKNAKKYKSVIA